MQPGQYICHPHSFWGRTIPPTVTSETHFSIHDATSYLGFASRVLRYDISGRQVIAVVAGVIPGFVDAAHVVNRGQDCSRASVDHVFVGRKSLPVVVRASHEEIITRTLDDARGHAVRHDEAVDDDRTMDCPDSRIDLIDGSNRQVRGCVAIAHQEVPSVWIKGRAADASDGNGSEGSAGG